MTVAAVILAATPASAIADADGTPGVRRLADVAWAGGATPVVVVSFDPDGDVARALANSEASLVDPAAPEGGPAAQIARGIEAARQLVTATDAVLVWPARMAWVDAETVTTLIAAHGEDVSVGVRPTYGGDAGWPVLLPVTNLDRLRGLSAARMPEELLDDLASAGVLFRTVETGDPGVIHDVTVPRLGLPEYDGPPEPADSHAHEWGAAAADTPDDAPLEGPPRLTLSEPGP
jgi:CTP:molybdopterin cytidylyltransferase MocA